MFFEFPLASVNKTVYLSWGEKLFNESIHNGGGTAEGAIEWLNTKSPKFGLLSPLKNFEGKFAAEALMRGLHMYTRQYAIEIWKSVIKRLIESAVLNTATDNFGKFIAENGASLIERSDLSPELINTAISEGTEILKKNKSLIERQIKVKQFSITPSMLKNPSTALDHIRVTEYKHNIWKETMEEVITALMKQEKPLAKSEIIKQIKTKLSQNEVISDYADESITYASIKESLEGLGYQIIE